MKQETRSQVSSWKTLSFLSLAFLLFFQLVSDFIESVYTFGLLGTDIPPEMVSVVLFFTPALLLLFKNRLPFKTIGWLAGAAAILHALEIALPPAGKMLAGGLGLGLFLLMLPVLMTHTRQGSTMNGIALGSSLTVALALSVLLRTLGYGSDITLLYPWIGWIFSALLLGAALLLPTTPEPTDSQDGNARPSLGSTTALSIGFLGVLLVLYYAFTSPTVLARWSAVDYRLILLFLALAFCLVFALLVYGRIQAISGKMLAFWNGLLLLSGTAGIFINQTSFSVDSAAFPLYQADLSGWLQIPLLIMLLLSPILIIDFMLLVQEIAARRPSNRQLAGGFTIAALFFLLIILAQVFTTVYDYIPVIGPWFRDRFWLVFLVAGLSMALPLLAVRQTHASANDPVLRVIFFPIVLSCMLVSVVVAVIREPTPVPPAGAQSLRVVTYNLQQGYDQNGHRAYLEQLEVIRSLNPDIVGLQETDLARFSGGNADPVRLIAEGLNMVSYYGPKTVNGTFGIALLSRYPLENPRTFFMYSSGEQTAAITADIEVGGTRFHVLVTHLGNGGPIIQQQQVLQELVGKNNIIAMGDFNFRPDTEQYALTINTLENAWILAGQPLVPGLDPADLIDHVFVSPGTTVQSAGYILSEVSDHPGLMVEIKP